MKRKHSAFVRIALGLLSIAAISAQAADVHVASFGAIPDDGLDDRQAIQAAIVAASSGLPRICRFDAGVYNLTDPVTGTTPLLLIQNANALTLIGAVDPNGEPATVLERNIATTLTNQMDLARVIQVEGGGNITLKNLVVDNNPRFATAGECVFVDVPNDVVEVDVFAGLPHFDGMQAFSANAWDIATRDLIGGVQYLSIGTNVAAFTDQWQHVPGGDGRRYRLENMGFAAKLNVGDGVSWHFNVDGSASMLRGQNTSGLTLENILFPNAPVALASLNNVANLTCREVVLAPLGDQFAVGPRDGFFMSFAHGEYIFEDCYFKGLRWDPISLFNRLIFIDQMLDSRTADVFWYSSGTTALSNLEATLWFANGPVTATIQSNSWGALDTDSGSTIRRGTVTFTADLPEGFGVGDSFSPHMRTLTAIRNTTFEGNYGRSPYLSGINMVIEDCTFRNNGYAFALGPSSTGAGAFCRDVVIRNNIFSDSVWDITTQPPTSGAIRLYENHGTRFTNESYSDNILIENNIFSGINFGPQYAAIDVQNAQNVTIRCNTYIDTPNEVQIQQASTQAITIVDDGLPGGCQTICPGNQIVADFNDMLPGAMRINDGQLADTGTGFAEDYWSAETAQIRVLADDLTAPVSTGYKVVQIPPAQRVQGVFPTADRRQARQTVPVSGDPDIWISFLIQNVEATDVTGIDFMETHAIDPTPTTTLRKIVLEGTTLKVVSSGAGGGTVDISSKYVLGQTAFVLAKLTPNALSQAEQLEVWIDPDVSNGIMGLPASDFTQPGDLEWDMDSITWLGLQSWDTGASGIGGYVDNIRISDGPCGFDFVVTHIPGNCDGDRDLDWMDYLNFERCLAGPGNALTGDCICSDLDTDNDVDASDLNLMQLLYTSEH